MVDSSNTSERSFDDWTDFKILNNDTGSGNQTDQVSKHKTQIPFNGSGHRVNVSNALEGKYSSLHRLYIYWMYFGKKVFTNFLVFTGFLIPIIKLNFIKSFWIVLICPKITL